jgi:hypothetical protein
MATRTATTPWFKLGIAATLGASLYQLLVVVLVGYLAAVAVPPELFAWFGKQRQEIALAVVDLAMALPVAALVAFVVYRGCRALNARDPRLLVAVLAGMLLCWTFWAVSFLQVTPAELPEGVQPFPVGVRIQQVLAVPWWSLPTTIAPWFGFALAAALLRRQRDA